MARTTLTLMLITLISKITGLFREQAFAYFLGTGDVMDAIKSSYSLPQFLFGAIFASLIAGYIPVYSEVKNKYNEEKANELTSNIINILLIIALAFVILTIILSPLLVSIFTPGYSGSKRELSIQFTRIFSLTIFPVFITGIFISFLQIKNRFIVAETQGIIMNIFHIITAFLFFYFQNYYILPIGILISEFLKYMFFPKAIKSERYKHKFILNFKDKYFFKLIKFAVPLFISISATNIVMLSDQSLSSVLIPSGGVSVMSYANLLYDLVSGILVTSIITTTYPTISNLASKNKIKEMKTTLMQGLSFGYVLIIPAIVGILILASPIVKIVFERGNFDSNSTMLTSELLFFLIPTLLGFTAKSMFFRGFYALQNTVTPIFVTLFQVTLNIILNYSLSSIFGINGLAIATAISSILAMIFTVILFKRKYGLINFMVFIFSTLKVLLASCLMGIVTYTTYNLIHHYNSILALLISVILSIISYSIFIIFMRIPEVMKTVNIIYNKYLKKS